MTKNIIVLDSDDNVIGETYPKRAKGLIKCGRAEFVDDGAIRLVSPPSAKNERMDIKMSETIKNTQNIQKTELKEVKEAQERPKFKTASEAEKKSAAALDINDLSFRIDQLMDQLFEKSDHITSVLERHGSDEKILNVCTEMIELLRASTFRALSVYNTEACGLNSLAAAVENVSREKDAGSFAASMMQDYRLTIEKLNESEPKNVK